MKGLRTTETKKFLNYFKKVQELSNVESKVFFLDFGECKQIEFKDMEVDVLFGWLIPQGLSDDFEKKYIQNRIEEKWNEYYKIVDFKIKDNSLNIIFR